MSASWKSATNGDWSQAADWTSNAVPDATSDVTIAVPGSYTVTVSSAEAAHSLTLNDPGATLQIGAALTVGATFTGTSGFVTIEAGQTLNLKGPTNLGLAGTSNGPVFDGPGALDTSGTTTLVTQTSNAFDIYLGGGIIWTNTGIVNDGGRIGIGRIAHDSATIVNAAGATFNLIDDPAGITGNASGATSSFKNAGTLAKTGGTGTSYITSTITNTGTIAVNTGTLEIDTGGTFGGTITGAGTIAFAAGSSELGGAVITIADVLLDGGAVTVSAASSTITKTLSLESGRLTIAAGKALTLSGSANFDTPGRTGAAIAGPGTLVTSGITTLATQADYTDDVFIGNGLTWLNTGVVNEGGRIGAGEIGHDTATIVNAAGATFNLLNDFASVVGGAAGSSYSTSVFKNAGLLEKTGGTGISNILSTVTNTGTIAVNTGTLEIDTGGTFSGGNITGAGTIAFAAGSSELGGAVITIADVLLDGGAVTVSAAPLTLGHTLSLESGSLTIAGGKTLTLSGPASFDTPGRTGADIAGPGTLVTSGTTTLATQTDYTDDVFIGHGLTWLNTGVVNDGGRIGAGEIGHDTATIVNAAGATFNLLNDFAGVVGGAAGSSYSTSVFKNAGLLEKTGGTGISNVLSTVTNTGTIAVDTGTLEIDTGGTFSGGTITGAGTIAFAAGNSELGGAVITAADLLLDGGYVTISAADLTLKDTVLLEAGHVTIASGRTLTLAGMTSCNVTGDPSAVSIFGPGTLLTSGTMNLATQTSGGDDLVVGYGGTWINTGTVNDGGHIGIGEKSYDTATIINKAGGVINFLNDAANIVEGEPGAPYSAATLNNAGLIIKTGGTATSHIAATVTNTGTIAVASGTLQLDGGGVFTGGTITGAGTIAFDSGGSELGGAVITAAGMVLDGGYATISAANTTLAKSVYLESGHITLAVGRILTLSGPAYFNAPGDPSATSIFGHAGDQRHHEPRHADWQ